MMLLAAAAVVVTVTTAKDQLDQPRPWWAVVLLLWPVWLVAVLAFGVFPLFGQFRRAAKEKQGVLLAYPYEFAFRLDEDVDAKKLRDYIRSNEHRELPTDLLGTLFVTTRGIGRIERMPTDTTVAKLHSAVAFRMGWQYARFEVISEVLIHKIGIKMQHVLLQCRIFGEAPKALERDELIELLKAILDDLVNHIGKDDPNKDDDKFDVNTLIEKSLYLEPPPDTATKTTSSSKADAPSTADSEVPDESLETVEAA